jgi:hypothetical protein
MANAINQIKIDNLQNNSSTQSWKNYTSKLGFTMQVPTNYLLKIKTNPLFLGPDLVIQSLLKPRVMFLVTNATEYSNNSTDEALLTQNEYLYMFSDGNYSIDVGNVTNAKWKISGNQAGSFTLSLADKENKHPITKNEIIITIHDGRRFIFTFSTPTAIFDNPKIKDLENKLVNSIKWIT